MGHFFDWQDGGPLRLELRSIDGRDFTLLRRIGYRSRRYDEPFGVPADPEHFTTDLASVPWMFGWLVPRSGEFTPAAVLHDGLVLPGGYLGPVVDRTEADLIFREAMVGLGTGRVRAWLMWSATTLGTMWHSRSPLRRALLVGLLGTVAVLGVLATLDLVDVWDVLPWMGERSLRDELVGGALGALVVPSVLALSWGRLAPAGVIASVALAFLLHVTAVIVLLYAGYRVLERLVSGPATPDGVRLRDRVAGA
ncbi:MAG TPA: DUF1353 domain-containing protein [Ornithinicoccus sp.]|nr:DUF1353 domain-containing protein [Ornithinicoccus sp.]